MDGTTLRLEPDPVSKDVIGIRIARNSEVLFVDGNGLDVAPGNMIVVELFADEGNEVEASVVISAGQMLHASVEAPTGRALRTFRNTPK